MEAKLELGDTVQLKSGSPMMTITKIDQSDVNCVWFDGSQAKFGCFPTWTLTKAKPRLP